MTKQKKKNNGRSLEGQGSEYSESQLCLEANHRYIRRLDLLIVKARHWYRNVAISALTTCERSAGKYSSLQIEGCE